MHHAWVAAWRPACHFVRSGRTLIDRGQSRAFSLLARTGRGAVQSCDLFSLRARSSCQSRKQEQSLGSYRPLSSAVPLRFQQASQPRQQIPPRAPSELAFRRNDLRPYELKVVFGLNAPSTALGNTLLKVVHSRRINGTLDLDLPPKLALQLRPYPKAFDDALEWLRQHYPIDEDAAILQRIAREETGEGNEELITRAENLGLYKPQSGVYGAKLGEEGDIFGDSELQRLRRENELKAEREQEELDHFIEQKQEAKHQDALSLEAKREDGLEASDGSRPPNEFEKWKIRHYLSATSKTTFEEALQTSKFRRLFPSFVFAAAVTFASYLFAVNWTPPDHATRLMPSEPLPRATILGIVYINCAVLALWRMPPAWRILNRYFTTTPAVVRPFSNLGNIFSHQSFSHFAINMFLLWILGNPLSEQIGRGDFLAIYIASGVFGSIASLTNMVMRNVLVSSSMGASGAISGVVTAFCTINPDTKMTLWLFPEQWAERLSCNASTLLVIVIVFEILSMTVPFLNRRSTDYAAHLGGYAMGVLGGFMWKTGHGGSASGPWRVYGSKESRWYEKLLAR